jgi:hypothetical protein
MNLILDRIIEIKYQSNKILGALSVNLVSPFFFLWSLFNYFIYV